MLKTFELCKRKFEYKYIKGITIPVDTFKMQQGKNIHALANYYLKNYNIDKLEKALTPDEETLWNALKNIKQFTTRPRRENESDISYNFISEDEFMKILDECLRDQNSDYDAKRSGDIFLDAPTLVVASEGLFDRWLGSTGKLGGQRKIPRLSNDRDIIEQMLKMQ